MLMTLLNDDDFFGIYLAHSKKYVPTDPLKGLCHGSPVHFV